MTNLDQTALTFALALLQRNTAKGEYMTAARVAAEAYTLAEAMQDQSIARQVSKNVDTTKLFNYEDWTPLMEGM